MNNFTPWEIENGTLQLLPWEHGAGDVLVTVDVFEAWEGQPADRYGQWIIRVNHSEHWPGLMPCNLRGGNHAATVADCLQALFAHIDAHPATHYVLRTLHPERVREAWCHGGIPYLGPMDRSPEETTTEWARRLVRTQLRRPNVTLGTGPIRTQEDADRLCPLALPLADLCGGLELWLQPVERIQFPLPCRESVFWGGFRRITVTGGAQPLHPDNVRCLRDQAVEAGVALAFLGWGEWWPESQGCGQDSDEDCEAVWQCVCGETAYPLTDNVRCRCGDVYTEVWCRQLRVGSENSGNTLDGRTWPWELNAPATPGEG